MESINKFKSLTQLGTTLLVPLRNLNSVGNDSSCIFLSKYSLAISTGSTVPQILLIVSSFKIFLMAKNLTTYQTQLSNFGKLQNLLNETRGGDGICVSIKIVQTTVLLASLKHLKSAEGQAISPPVLINKGPFNQNLRLS